MAVPLTSEQQQVVGTARSRARRFGASPRETKALIEALGVESNYRDLPYGDRDSEGALQQRPSQGWGSASESLETDVDQFLQAARRANTGGGSAGQLAQRVQRSAFPGRYDARSAEADALLRGTGARAAAAPRMPSPAAEQSAGQRLTSLVIDPPEPHVPRQSMGLAAPAFAAGPKLAGGMAVASGSPAESPGQRLTRALGEVAQLSGTETPTEPERAAEPVRTGSGAASAGARGVAKITGPNPGRVSPLVTRFMRQISAVRGGRPVVGSDGTGHSRLTANGRVSEHTTGNASDIPAAGSELVRLGQAALIAAGMPRAQARKQRGGLYNVVRDGVRYQVIFATDEGGNHFDHLHVGAHRV